MKCWASVCSVLPGKKENYVGPGAHGSSNGMIALQNDSEIGSFPVDTVSETEQFHFQVPYNRWQI